MAIRFDQIELSSSGHNYYPVISGVNSAQYLQIQTEHGYTRIGADNTSWSHFYTDRPNYYFNRGASFSGNIAAYGGTHTASFATYYDSNDTTYYVDPAGTSQVNSIEFVGSTNNARIGQPVSSEWGTRITTDSGYILFGPANTSHAHIYTDRSNFYFNKQIQLLGGSLINQNDIRAQIFYDTADTNYFIDPASTSVMNNLQINDYIYHKDDTHTYFGFSGNDAFAMVFEGTTRLSVADSTDPVFSYNAHINMNNKDIDYVNQLHFGANVRFYDESNDSTLYYKYGDTGYGQIKFQDGNGTATGTLYAESGYFGTLSPDQSWAVQSSNTLTNIQHQARSPIFYDLDNTAYYADPSGTSVFNIITSTGNVVLGNSRTDKVNIYGNLGIGHNNYPKVAYPGQNALWSGQGSTTGQIVIDLPGTLANYDMMYMEIDIYEYSGDAATKLIVGGHNWNSGGNSNTSTTQWYNVNVQVLGRLTKPVYFGRRNDGSNERRCIAIGETTSTWSYATVHVHKVHGAEFYGTAIDWVGDWNIAQTTSTSYFTKNPTTNFNDGGSQTFETNGIGEANHWFGSTSVRSPIFYDLDNTSYYVNPAGDSEMNQIRINDYIRHRGDLDTFIGFPGNNVFRVETNGSTRLNIDSGGKVGINTTDADGQGYSYAEDLVILGGASASDGVGITLRGNGKRYGVIAFGDNSDDNPGEIYYDHNNDSMDFRTGTSVALQLQSGNVVLSYGDMRAPVFYDSNNTGYYVNPSGSSVMNDIGIDDYITHNGDPSSDTYFGFPSNDHFTVVTAGGTGLTIDSNRNSTFGAPIWIPDYVYHVGDSDTYFGFSGANSIKFVAGGTERLRVEGDVKVLGTTDLNIQGSSRRLQFTSGTGTVRTTTENDLILQSNSTNGLRVRGSDQATIAYVNMQAPVFYDSNDTNYYTNPNGTSVMSALTLGSTFTQNGGDFITHGTQTGDLNTFWQVAGTGKNRGIATGRFQSGASNSFTSANNANWIMNIYSHAGSSGNYPYGIQLGGTDTGDRNLMIRGVSNGTFGSWARVFHENSSDLRSPIFYDSNDTNYYVDPNNTGISLKVAGRAEAYQFRGGVTASGDGDDNQPFALADDYSSWAIIFGEAWTNNNGWGIFWAGNDNPAYSYWSTTNPNEAVFVGGGNVRASIDLDNGASYFGNQVRTPILYDSGNTGYYVDPAGTSNLNVVTAGTLNVVNVNASQGIKTPNQRTNYVAHKWVAGSSFPQAAVFDGSFQVNGSSSENVLEYGVTPSGGRGLLWKATNNDTTSNADGGWAKNISNLSDDKAYISICYVKRVGTSTSGSFYHGCHGSHTLNMDGTANTNPYFIATNIGNLTQDVWCVSIGIIQANNDSNTGSWSDIDGVYRLDTGERILDTNTFKMKDGSTSQSHRTYLYYSTDANAQLQWYNPGFYEINGQEPTLNEILNRDKNLKHTGPRFIASDTPDYWGAGNTSTNDSWKWFHNSGDLKLQARESGSWLDAWQYTGASVAKGNSIYAISDSNYYIDIDSWYSLRKGRITEHLSVGNGTGSQVDTTKAALQVYGNNNTDGTVRLGPHSTKGPNFSHIHYGSTGDWYIRPAGNTGKIQIADSATTQTVNVGNINGSFKFNVAGGIYASGSSQIASDGYDVLKVSGAGSTSGPTMEIKTSGTTSGADSLDIYQANTIYGPSAIRFFYGSTSSTAVGSIRALSSSTQYNTSSDYRLKENVVELTGALDRVDNLKPKRFNFINNPDVTVDGFLAHEAQEVIPQAVTGEKDMEIDGKPYYQGIDHGFIVPLLTAAIKELKAQNEDLLDRVKALENK